MYTEPLVTISLKEYTDMKTRLTTLEQPTEGPLTHKEQMEAAGELLYRAVNNPQLFTRLMPGKPVILGKYVVHAVMPPGDIESGRLPIPLINFERK